MENENNKPDWQVTKPLPKLKGTIYRRESCLTCVFGQKYIAYVSYCVRCRVWFQGESDPAIPRGEAWIKKPGLDIEKDFVKTQRMLSQYDPTAWFLEIERIMAEMEGLYNCKGRMWEWKARSLQKYRIIKKIKALVNKAKQDQVMIFPFDLERLLRGDHE
jgi:hypothetical protein